MAKTKPIITNVEILCRAIRSVEDEINAEKARYTGTPGMECYLEGVIAELVGKLDALHNLYHIETGTEYV